MKKLFCLVFSLLTLLTISCGTQRAAALTESSIPSMASASSASSEESSAKKAPPRDDTSETVWSTSDIDVSHVDINKKLIVFSFDDAPDVTLKPLMRTFASFNAQNPDCPASATFFSNGIRIDATTFSRLKEAYAAGFELGNHTNRHKDLTKLPPEKIREEISVVDEILCKIDGKRNHLLRVPYGNFNDKVKKQAETPLIDWSIDTEDWKGISAQQIYDVVWKEKYPGAIVLMHDGYPNTVEAVKRLLPALKDNGYQVVNVSQLSKALDCSLVAGSVYTHIRQK